MPQLGTEKHDQTVAILENIWLEVEISQQGSAQNALLYGSLFGPPVPVTVKGWPVPAHTSAALSRAFSLRNLPTIGTQQFSQLLQQNAGGDLLAVYDVGQGNANALVRADATPTLYFDLGAAVYRNYGSRPTNLRFCFGSKQPIVLSHWHADHWAGARAAQYPPGQSPTDSTWIVPLQQLSPIHSAFAYGITTGGGTVLVYDPPPATVGVAKLSSDTIIKFSRGAGPDKNGSGIVLVVERKMSPTDFGSWLLTGDCDYGYFFNHVVPAAPVAVVVPHHGANAHTPTVPPTPAPDYRRLIYSFGSDNKNGPHGLRHPNCADRAGPSRTGLGFNQMDSLSTRKPATRWRYTSHRRAPNIYPERRCSDWLGRHSEADSSPMPWSSLQRTFDPELKSAVPHPLR